MLIADEWGLGLGFGLIVATALSKVVFAPNILYSVSLISFQLFLVNYGDKNEDALA